MKKIFLILFTISTFFLPIATDNVENYLKKESANIVSSSPITKLPRGAVVMIASPQIDDWFNMNGKGLGEYAGWYLCDGRNGTPDLRGRFVVGRDILSNNSSYPNISMTGGLDKVILTVDELPSHSHTFEADTSAAGVHSHNYNDVTYADGCDLLVPMYRGIRSGDPNNKACQIGRTTESTGNHNHHISGATGNIGGNKSQENRPPYYVVAYIIYMDI